eukprot:scaffold381_cov178-Amphora_coffeaeformis.AAC.21
MDVAAEYRLHTCIPSRWDAVKEIKRRRCTKDFQHPIWYKNHDRFKSIDSRTWIGLGHRLVFSCSIATTKLNSFRRRTIENRCVYKVSESGSDYQFGTQEQDVIGSPEQIIANFRRGFQFNVLERPTPNDMVFEMIGVDASFANALRRILLSEVPTVAIESVYMWNNTSLVHDEVLSHRLGLIPIHADPRYLDVLEPGEEATDKNTLVFRLTIYCKKPYGRKGNTKRGEDDESDAGAEAMDELVHGAEADLVEAATEASTTRPYRFPQDRPYTHHVYSKDLEWMPQNDQEERMGKVRPVHDDILIAKLRPGQCIELEAHARVGLGKDHAKFSPVATACYRLMPKIVLKQPVYDEVAEELIHVYEPGVFRLEPTDPQVDPPHARVKAVVDNPYACTMSRNYLRHPILAKAVEITRVPNHFIFSVESVGMFSPPVLVAEGFRILQSKCQKLLGLADEADVKAQANRMDIGSVPM